MALCSSSSSDASQSACATSTAPSISFSMKRSIRSSSRYSLLATSYWSSSKPSKRSSVRRSQNSAAMSAVTRSLRFSKSRQRARDSRPEKFGRNCPCEPPCHVSSFNCIRFALWPSRSEVALMRVACGRWQSWIASVSPGPSTADKHSFRASAGGGELPAIPSEVPPRPDFYPPDVARHRVRTSPLPG